MRVCVGPKLEIWGFGSLDIMYHFPNKVMPTLRGLNPLMLYEFLFPFVRRFDLVKSAILLKK